MSQIQSVGFKGLKVVQRVSKYESVHVLCLISSLNCHNNYEYYCQHHALAKVNIIKKVPAQESIILINSYYYLIMSDVYITPIPNGKASIDGIKHNCSFQHTLTLSKGTRMFHVTRQPSLHCQKC